MTINFGGDPTYNNDPYAQDPNAPHAIDLGNGYTIVYPGSGLPPTVHPTITQGGGTQFAPEHLGAAQIGAQTSAAQLAEQRRQYNETLGYNKSVNDQQYGLSAAGLSGMYNGQPTENARQFNTKSALDYYNHLSDLASNPRNFVQTFFQSRGQLAPTGSQQYGNVDIAQRGNPAGNGASYGPAADAARTGYGPRAQMPMAGPAPTGPAPTQSTLDYMKGAASGNQQQTGVQTPVAGAFQPGASYHQSIQNTDGSVTDIPANTPSTIVSGGQQSFVGNQPAGFSYDQGKWNTPTAYSQGGVVPEPVVGVGVHTGKKYIFGEHGPEGVVPAGMLPHFLQQRHGQMAPQGHAYARGGIIGDTYGTPTPDPTPPSTPPSSGGNMLDPGPTSNYAGPGGYQVDPYVVNQVLNPTPTPTAPAPTNDVPPPTNNPVQATNAANLPSTATGPAPVITAPTTGAPPAAALQPPATGSVTPIVQQPLGTPQASNNFNAAGAPGPGLTPGDVAPPGTFGSPSGNRPQFLPGEDNGGSVLQALLRQNALPPFLSRLFAQNHGVQSEGTNTPQRNDLPKDVPLVSKLAYSQMQPSEQQALLSYVSAYGVTPEDYLAAIEQYAPQGSPTRLPTFGQHFTYQRQ